MLNQKIESDISVISKMLMSSIKIFDSRIITGDVIKVLNILNQDDKFDVIIADPPYNIGKDFGNNTTQKDIAQYMAWSTKWLNLCLALLAENGLIYVYGFPEILARIASQYPIDQQRILAWHYTNKTTPCATFWQRSYESILCLWKSNRPKLAIEQMREPYTDSFKKLDGKKRKGTSGRFGSGKETAYKVNAKGALPRDVIKVPTLAGRAGSTERWFMCHTCGDEVYPPHKLAAHLDHDILKHPTQKPMRLTERLMKSIINGHNGRILIPFASSGSECIVAHKLGIQFLGIEMNPQYVDFTNKWLRHV